MKIGYDMMKSKRLVTFFLSFYIAVNFSQANAVADFAFIPTRDELDPFYNKPHVFMITSPGRSGSTLLNDAIKDQLSSDFLVLKSHLLPPRSDFQGKILFIFSNPDKAAESALHLTYQNDWFGSSHFNHVETSDKNWLNKIGNTSNQTDQYNLLAYDALGSDKQLLHWLYMDTLHCEKENANVLAIKFENLWDEATIDAIRYFIGCPSFMLPSKKNRGYSSKELQPFEKALKSKYNKASASNPKYTAYDNARELWKKSPAYQFLIIK